MLQFPRLFLSFRQFLEDRQGCLGTQLFQDGPQDRSKFRIGNCILPTILQQVQQRLLRRYFSQFVLQFLLQCVADAFVNEVLGHTHVSEELHDRVRIQRFDIGCIAASVSVSVVVVVVVAVVGSRGGDRRSKGDLGGSRGGRDPRLLLLLLFELLLLSLGGTPSRLQRAGGDDRRRRRRCFLSVDGGRRVEPPKMMCIVQVQFVFVVFLVGLVDRVQRLSHGGVAGHQQRSVSHGLARRRAINDLARRWLHLGTTASSRRHRSGRSIGVVILVVVVEGRCRRTESPRVLLAAGVSNGEGVVLRNIVVVIVVVPINGVVGEGTSRNFGGGWGRNVIYQVGAG
mmetsp:Transcript_2378/g.6370  ORF Transcript_2378/g.6370 Transcript_2378/m.6370 type:complete len:341 (-) Transcript_2378:325-1347(-)